MAAKKPDPHYVSREKEAPAEERLPRIRSLIEEIEAGKLEVVSVDETPANSDGSRLMIISYRRAPK